MNIVLEFDVATRFLSVNDRTSLLYSENGGTSWDALESSINTGFCPSDPSNDIWAHQTTTLPSSANNNSNVKIAFAWTNNDDCLGSGFSVVIDNLTLSITCSLNVSIQNDNSVFCIGSNISFQPDTFNSGFTYIWNISNDSNYTSTKTCLFN